MRAGARSWNAPSRSRRTSLCSSTPPCATCAYCERRTHEELPPRGGTPHPEDAQTLTAACAARGGSSTEKESPMPYVSVGKENSGSIDLYYEDHGAGTPVVLI